MKDESGLEDKDEATMKDLSPSVPCKRQLAEAAKVLAEDHISARYSQRLLVNLNSLRDNSDLCDVEIIPGWRSNESSPSSTSPSASSSSSSSPKQFFAHRTILAAASPYFNAMFTGGLVEARRQQIFLPSMGDRTLDSLLRFIYSGRVDVHRDNVQELIIAADMIALREVVEICTNYLIDEIDPSNALGFYRFASDHNFHNLKEQTEKFIHENFVTVSKAEEFPSTPHGVVLDLLANEHLRVDSEYQVFLAGMRWLESDIAARRCHIFEVLKLIRLPLVPSKLLESYLSECRDAPLKVALRSLKTDLSQRTGSLVPLAVIPRQGAKKNIYVIGGSQRELGSAWNRNECTYQTVEVFDTFVNSWQQAAPMRIGRILPGLAVLDGYIYVCGGEEDSEILANGEVYDPSEDSWSEMAAMGVPRCEFGMCALDGYLYAFGGWVGEDIGDSIERYDPRTDEWTEIDSMAEPRFSMGIFAYDDLIFLVGGCTHSRRHMQELVSYNPRTREWITYASMLVPRSQMGCVLLDDHLYVLGGTNRQNEVLNSVERYSFKYDKWEILPPMNQQRASCSVAATNNKIYVFGGDQIGEVNFYRARTTISHSEFFDPLTNKWTISASLPKSRSEAGAVVV